jgi:parallel beta-helix repeat protein
MRTHFFAAVLIAALPTASRSAETPKPDVPHATINVADFADVASFTGGIQEAVDSLPKSGGVVTIPQGEYLLRQGIVLRTNVTLQGAGSSTILRKQKHVETKLAVIAQQGSRSVQVASAEGFATDDQVAIRDRDAQGANVMRATIKDMRGNTLMLDRPLFRTFDPAKTGFVIHMFPAITAEQATNIVIKDLAIKDDAVRDFSVYGPVDARNKLINWPTVLPFHLSSIHLNLVGDSRVEGVSVSGWLSDGISVQGGSIKGPSSGSNVVTRCVVENCGGMGLHPGGGLHDSEFSHNISRGNGIAGLYFCSAVQRVAVIENELINNKVDGITGLGDYDDKFNTVIKNVISGNGRYGIAMNGDNNTVVDNMISNNSQTERGKYSGIYLGNSSKCVVKGNHCFDNQRIKTQKHGIEELSDCRENTIIDNDCRGNVQTDVVLAADQPKGIGRK